MDPAAGAERRKRSRVIASVGLIWAVAWAVAGYAGLGHGSQNSAYVEMNAAVAIVWLPCPSPAYPATAHATAQISPTEAMTRDRFRRS